MSWFWQFCIRMMWMYLQLALIDTPSISHKRESNCDKWNGQFLEKLHAYMGSFVTRLHGQQTRSVYPLILCRWQKQSCWYTELEIFSNVSQAGPFIPQWSSGGSFAQGWGSYLFMLRTPAALTEVLPRLVLGLLMPFWPECILGTERKWERGENVFSVIL